MNSYRAAINLSVPIQSNLSMLGVSRIEISELKMLRELSQLLIPTRDSDAPLVRARKQIICMSAYFAAISGAASGILSYSASLENGLSQFVIWAGILGPVSFLFVPFIMRKFNALRACAYGMMAVFYGFIMLILLSAGGTAATTSIYLAGFPVLASILLGYRHGIAASVLAVLTYIGLFVALEYLPGPAYAMTPRAVAYWNAFTLCFLVLSVGGCLAVYHRVLDATAVNLDRALVDANVAKAQLELHRDPLSNVVKERTREVTDKSEALELKTLELEEQALKLEQALQSERELNEMQSQFVSMASHEFRTPLTIIDGTARRLAKKADTIVADEITERSNHIRKTVKRLTVLVERTLDSSKLASGKIRISPEPFDVREKSAGCYRAPVRIVAQAQNLCRAKEFSD